MEGPIAAPLFPIQALSKMGGSRQASTVFWKTVRNEEKRFFHKIPTK